jgi:hypothetical protein
MRNKLRPSACIVRGATGGNLIKNCSSASGKFGKYRDSAERESSRHSVRVPPASHHRVLRTLGRCKHDGLAHLLPAAREQAQLGNEDRVKSLLRDRWIDYPESVQKLGRSISSGLPGLRHGRTVCAVRWRVPACRRCTDAFAVTRVGNLERRDATRREFPFKTATLTCAIQCAPSSVQRICRFLAIR